MKISNEARVGIIGIVTIAVLFWGINYLKGRNIFNTAYTLYTFYQESGGLEISSPVLINGVKVGYVEDIQLRTSDLLAIKVVLKIEQKYTVGEGSQAELFSSDLLGTKAIKIITSDRQEMLEDRDTITGLVEPDLISSLQTAVFPVLENARILTSSLDSLSRQMESIISHDGLSQIIENLAELTYSLNSSLAPGGSLDESFKNLESFTGVLSEEKDEMASMIENLNSVSESLSKAGLDSLSIKMTSVFSQLTMVMEQINSGEGSAGKILYSDSLYHSITGLVNDMDILVRDLKENPKDYVQVSVFEKKEKEKKNKE